MDKLSEIRVSYSGIVALSTGIIRIFLNLGYITIITRLLTPEQFGTWQLIIGMLVYVMVLHWVETYWITRETARNIDSGKTAIFTGGLFSTIGIIIFTIIIISVSNSANVDFDTLLLAVIIIPVQFFFNILVALNYGWKPQNQSYGQIVSDSTKLISVFFLLSIFNMELQGVIISAFLGNIVGVLVLLHLGRERITGNFNIKYLKKWLRLSWLPLYPSAGSVIFALDVLVFTLIIGNTEGLGYYGAALIIAITIGHAGLIFSAVYPKLLGSKETSFLSNSITRLFYFLIPFLSIVIIFGESGLHILNPLYVVVYPALIFLSIKFFFFTIFDSANFVLRGIEKVDINEQSKFKDFIKSKLFFIPTIQLIQYSLYLVSVTIIFILFKNSTVPEIIFNWSIISVSLQIPFTLFLVYVVRKNVKFSINYKSIVKYIGATIISIYLLGYFLQQSLNFNQPFFEFLIQFTILVSITFLAYVVITFCIDNNTRIFIKSIFNEIKSKS